MARRSVIIVKMTATEHVALPPLAPTRASLKNVFFFYCGFLLFLLRPIFRGPLSIALETA